MSDTGARPKEQKGLGSVNDWNPTRTDTSLNPTLTRDKGDRYNEQMGPGTVNCQYRESTITDINIPPMADQGARPKEQRGAGKVSGHRNRTSTDIKHPSIQVSRRDEAVRHMSVRLYDVLDKVGASAEFRKLSQDCAISWEIIQTLAFQLIQQERLCVCYIFGSSSEGSTTPGMNSDTDALLCLDEHPVIDNISDAGDGLSFLMIRDKHTQPGYVKLQRVYNGQPQTVYTIDIDCDNDESDREGRICLKHVSGLGDVKALDERNGPADTDTELNRDLVVGFRCSKIPKLSREWIGRKRQYKWPSKRMIDKMSNMGCFVVGVGHPTSIEKNIEWRLSFSLQEREMMFSMNLVQHKCYVVLKMIKKDLIEPIVGKSISSYHLKTCMLHTIEKAVFCKLEQYERCIGVLDQLESKLNQKPISMCKCYRNTLLCTDEHDIQLSALSLPSIMSRTATCIIFLRSDMPIIPEALQYEMYRSINTPPGSRNYITDRWFDLAVVDAVVYLHFMQYFVHAKLNKVIPKHLALNKLKSVLQRDRYLMHRETGYNLLGWISFQEGWIQQGFNCLRKSWSIRPQHNAAKFHSTMLIFNG